VRVLSPTSTPTGPAGLDILHVDAAFVGIEAQAAGRSSSATVPVTANGTGSNLAWSRAGRQDINGRKCPMSMDKRGHHVQSSPVASEFLTSRVAKGFRSAPDPWVPCPVSWIPGMRWDIMSAVWPPIALPRVSLVSSCYR